MLEVMCWLNEEERERQSLIPIRCVTGGRDSRVLPTESMGPSRRLQMAQDGAQSELEYPATRGTGGG